MPRVDNDRFYRSSIQKHGLNSRGLHWRGPETQLVRFEQIDALLPSEVSLEIVDAGCGFGDLYLYLLGARKSVPCYTGLDVMEEMVLEASRRTGQTILARDVLNDPLPEAEYYVCSGALNILTPYEAHRFIRRCYEASQRGFVFNFLEGEDGSSTYNYLRTSHITALGAHLGARMVFRRGYLSDDCTVAFYKESR